MSPGWLTASSAFTSVAEHHREKGAVDLQAAVVVDEAHLPEAVHEVAHPRTGRANHRGERLLAHPRDHALRPRFLAEVREQQEDPGESLLAGVEELVDQVLFDPDV